MRGKKIAGLSTAALTVIAALIAIGVIVVAPLWAAGRDKAGSSYDPSTISNYDIDLTVDATGVLHAKETLRVDMPTFRHGIFRFWDVADGADSHHRSIPRDIEITQDGQPADVEMSWQDGRRYRVAKIGNPDEYLTEGVHTWVISYVVDGVLRKPGAFAGQGTWSGKPRGSEFVWDVVPGGWRMPITNADVKVHLPATAHDPRCDVARVDCAVSADGSTVTVHVGALQPDTPVTLSTRLDTKPSEIATLPWGPEVDPVLGRNTFTALVLGLIGLVALIIGRLLELTTREKTPGLPVLFEPPAGLGPIQAAYVANERVPSTALSATLLHLGDRGLVELERHNDNSWTVVGKDVAPHAWSAVDPISLHVAQTLGVTTPGGRFEVDRHKSAGSELASLTSSLPGVTRRWGIESGNLSKSAGVPWLRFLYGAAVLLALLTGLLGLATFGLLAWPAMGFVIGGVGLLRSETTTRRTQQGRELWSRAGGFRRMLATDSAEARFDFSARKELYTAYVPYAVAFGCAEAWARKYEAATGTAAPVPLWYGGGYVGGGGGSFGAGGFDSFDSALSSSISAYQASQSSSSGGGGGFSGGGFGGGGGGGGSW